MASSIWFPSDDILEKSIGQYGLALPVFYSPSGKILDGERRLAAAKRISFPVEAYEGADAWGGFLEFVRQKRISKSAVAVLAADFSPQGSNPSEIHESLRTRSRALGISFSYLSRVNVIVRTPPEPLGDIFNRVVFQGASLQSVYNQLTLRSQNTLRQLRNAVFDLEAIARNIRSEHLLVEEHIFTRLKGITEKLKSHDLP